MPAAQDADPIVTAERVERRDTPPTMDTVLLIVGLVALWQVGTLALGREALPSPVATISKLAAIMADEDFPRHAWETARAFLTALLISLVAGLAVGLALGAHRLASDVTEPVLTALYFVLLFFVPESPRWLFAKGQPDRAIEVLSKACGEAEAADELANIRKSFNESQSGSGTPILSEQRCRAASQFAASRLPATRSTDTCPSKAARRGVPGTPSVRSRLWSLRKATGRGT